MKIYNLCNNNVVFGINSKNLSNVTNGIENKYKKAFPIIEDFFVDSEKKFVPPEIEEKIINHMEEYASHVDTNEAEAIAASKHIYLNV